MLTHGAGSNCGAPLLVALAEGFSDAGWMVLRCDLPYRQKRPHGPPFGGSAIEDRAGLRNAVASITKLVEESAAEPGNPIVLGGHSYGGRQATMLAAEDAYVRERLRALLLLSYPLHPPRQPEKPRTAHFAALHTPALFVHGSRDPFGSIEELQLALKLIPVRTCLMPIEGAGHDLRTGKGRARGEADLPTKIIAAFQEFVHSQQ